MIELCDQFQESTGLYIMIQVKTEFPTVITENQLQLLHVSYVHLKK